MAGALADGTGSRCRGEVESDVDDVCGVEESCSVAVNQIG